MFYPILTSPQEGDPPAVRVAKLIQTIEALVDMREEVHEIEYEVSRIIPEVVTHFSAWATERGMTSITPGLPFIAEGFIRFCYLVHYGEVYPKKVSLFRIGKRHDEKFLDVLAEDVAEIDPQMAARPDFRKMNKMLLQYFRVYLKEIRDVHKKTFEAIMAGHPENSH